MQAVIPTASSQSLWLKSKAWDLVWITGSVLLVTIPYASYYIGQAIGFDPDVARNVVNGLVALLIGGPHMYATHLRTTLDPDFRSRHRSIYFAAFIIPAIVIYFGYFHFVFLLTFFFLWASVHVLHQIIYIVDCYKAKEATRGTGFRPALKDRWPDYAVILTALYPAAMYRFVHGTFQVGQNTLYYPQFLKHDAVWLFASAAFATAMTFFVIKSVREFREGRGNVPKTLLILVTAIVSFVTPMFRELDVAFQGMNTWHSFQYLGLTWYVNRLRYDRGDLVGAPRISLFSRPGEWWRFYGFNITLNIATLLTIALFIVTRNYTGLSFDQCYYMVVLCFLLTHYYHDHIIFSERTDLSMAPVGA